jgi:predicted transposase/invertase (TIGR01784 family)
MLWVVASAGENDRMQQSHFGVNTRTGKQAKERAVILGIRPTVDYAFKRLLGSPEHTAITVHFINAVLEGSPRIAEVELLNPILGKETASDKLAILDVRARDDHGRWLNVEMQTTLPAGLPQRLTYYVSSMYVTPLLEGESYLNLRPAISICLLDQLFFREVADPHLDFRLRDARHGLQLTDHLQVHLLELPKYNPGDGDLSAATALEQWLYFFRFASELSLSEVVERLPSPIFRQAAGVLEMISQTPRERDLYEARLKLERDEAARLQGAREEGRLEGRQEGERIGKLIGTIQTLQQLLQTDVSPPEELREQPEVDLTQRMESLQARLRERGVS